MIFKLKLRLIIRYFVNGEDFMPHCTNCNYKWKAEEVLILGFSKSGKDCPNCGKNNTFLLKQNPNKILRKTSGI